MARTIKKDGTHIYIANDSKLINHAIQKWQAIANIAIKKKDYFTVALSGGKTSIKLLQKLAQQKHLPWNKTHIFMVDERMVPQSTPENNYSLLKQNLLDPLKIANENIHPIHPETTSTNKSAQQYEVELDMFFQLQQNQFPIFDLIILGLGKDGHTASLFPQDPNVFETRHMVLAVKNQNKYDRVSITIPVINNANNIVFLVSGANKAKIVNEVINHQNTLLPATKIKPQHGNLYFLLNEAAGKLIQSDKYQLSFYVPKSHLKQVKQNLFDAGAGKVGNYDCTAWQTKGSGQFRPLAGSKPFLGKKNKIKYVIEYKVEMICDAEHIDQAVAALKNSHPYEEPAYSVMKLTVR